MCCAGCAAVASAIVDAGLDNYYARRDKYPESRVDALPGLVTDLSLFDRPEVQAGFVTSASAEHREAALILEGITCPACVWLNETHLARQPGIVSVRINYTTNRALVRWDTRLTSLSAILAAIRDIGYRAYPYDAQSLEAAQRREARGLLARFAISGTGDAASDDVRIARLSGRRRPNRKRTGFADALGGPDVALTCRALFGISVFLGHLA